MPVILPEGARDRWLDAGADPAGLQAMALEAEAPLVARVVSRWVNNVRNDDPACREPGEGDGRPSGR